MNVSLNHNRSLIKVIKKIVIINKIEEVIIVV
jgi:hypothetical protein